MFKKRFNKTKALLMGAFVAMGSATASASDIVSYDNATGATTWDTSGFVTAVMDAFQAGLSILLVFLPLGIGISLIIKYTKKGAKSS